jgi:hypothetical protein
MSLIRNKIRHKTIGPYILTLLFLLGMIMVINSCGPGAYREEGKLRFYSQRELLAFLKDMGFSGYTLKTSQEVTRNSQGTALRFIKWKTAVIASCDGSLEEIKLPSDDVWLDDQNRPLAWLYEGKVYYQNGMVEDPPFIADNRADPAGIYFMKPVVSEKDKRTTVGTSVFSIHSPDVPVVTISRFHGERIFSKGSRVFVFGSYFDTRKEQSELYIFQSKGQKLMQLEKVIIRRPHTSPAPFIVEDFSPWSDEVLFCDAHDFPSRSEWYVFDLGTRVMRRIGKVPFFGGRAFFLECDVVKRVVEREKNREN